MLLTNAIKKLGTFGEVKDDGRGLYWAVSGRHEVSFHVNGEAGPGATITCIRVRPVCERDDLQSDYFAGTFCDNLTQAIRLARG